MTKFIINKFIKDTDNPRSPRVREKIGVLSGTVGTICNTILFAAKLFVGITTSSIAVSADAFNNLSDVGSSIITLACFKIAGSPADREHPFGHGRIEYISALIVSVAIILAGLGFIKSSVEKILAPEIVTFDLISFVILIASLALKLWMGMFNAKLGEMTGSHAMKATSVDSFVDVAATATAISGMAITHFTGLYVDSYAGIVVALFIIFTGINMIRETLGPLVGQAPDPKLVSDINKFVLSYPNIVGIHDLMIHNYGPLKSVISLHAEMPANIGILDLHETIDKIEKDLKTNFNCQAVIHLDPIVTDDEMVNNIRTKISELVKLIDSSAKVYDLRVVPGNKTKTVIFDVFVPYNVAKKDIEIVESLKSGVKVLDESYECIINVNRTYFEINS